MSICGGVGGVVGGIDVMSMVRGLMDLGSWILGEIGSRGRKSFKWSYSTFFQL